MAGSDDVVSGAATGCDHIVIVDKDRVLANRLSANVANTSVSEQAVLTLTTMIGADSTRTAQGRHVGEQDHVGLSIIFWRAIAILITMTH